MNENQRLHIADQLDRTADRINTGGWAWGMYDGPGDSHCAVGAMHAEGTGGAQAYLASRVHMPVEMWNDLHPPIPFLSRAMVTGRMEREAFKLRVPVLVARENRAALQDLAAEMQAEQEARECRRTSSFGTSSPSTSSLSRSRPMTLSDCESSTEGSPAARQGVLAPH